jgi:hypothetical protein
MQPTEHSTRRSTAHMARRCPEAGGYIDPLDADQAGDMPVLTTERRLRRLAMTAAMTGARFERDQLSEDPMCWLLAPRTMFGGARPIDACQDLHALLRATLLHRLSLGMDARSDDLDALLADEEALTQFRGADEADEALEIDAGLQDVRVRLYTCTVEGIVANNGGFVQVFCAMVAPSESAVRQRLGESYGPDLAMGATIQEGFDGNGPLAHALLSGPLKRLLNQVDCDPDGRLAAGFDFRLEQRFHA